MIQENIKKWHDHIKGDFPGGFDELLADDVIFYSPIVFSPQRGKELTTLYLMAAGNTFVYLKLVPSSVPSLALSPPKVLPAAIRYKVVSSLPL